MASKIEGLTLTIGADTTALTTALKDVNKNAKNLQSELKDVENLLKFDPTNTELLAQKQKLLADSIANAKDKLDTLKTAAEQAKEQFDKGEITQTQYQALQREVIKTAQELEKLEGAASSSNATLSKIGATADKVAEGAGKVASATKGISTAAAAGIAGLATMAVKAGQAADDINTLSKQTGLSTEEIQKFKYASDIIDVSLDTLTGSMAKLVKNMSSAKDGTGTTAEAFKTLGVSITDSQGNLRNNQDVFADTIKALGGVSNETERDALAMQIFGKSAQDLNPLILGGADALKQLGDEAENSGLILSQDALDGANAFNDGIDKLKATAAAAFGEAGTTLSQSLLPALEDLVTKIADLLKWIGGLSEGQLQAIGTILLVVAAISPLATAISKVSTLVSFMSTTGIPALSAAFSFLAANPIILVVAAIAGLVVVLVNLFNTNQEFHDNVIAIWNGIKDFFTQTIPEIVNNIVTWFAELPSKVGGAVSGVLTSLGEWVTGVIAWIGGAIPQVIESIVNFFTELPNKIAYAIGFVIGTLIKWHLDVINWVITEVPKIIESVLTFFTELPGKIYDAIITFIAKLGEWAGNVGAWITTEVPKIISSVLTFFSELPSKIYNAILGVIGKIAQWKNDMISSIKAEIPKVITSITDFFTELPGKMVDIGANIVKGLWDGITAWADWLGRQVSGFTDGVVQGIKDALGIHSPSKVMADEIGKFIPLGLAKGINDFAYTVSDAVKSLATSVPKNFESNINYVASSSLVSNFSDSLGNIMDSVKTALSNVKDVISNDFANKVNYATTSSSSSDFADTSVATETTAITAEDIANIISVALLEGFTYVGDKIYDALPKGITMNLEGAKLATATWDNFDDIANKKRRIFSPSRNEIYDIAIQAARSITG